MFFRNREHEALREIAARDAAADVHLGKERVEVLIGPKPIAFDGTRPQHAPLARALEQGLLLEEFRDQERDVQQQLARLPSAATIVMGIVVALIVEGLSSIQLLKGYNIKMPERAIYGGSLALILTGLTGLLVKALSPRSGAERRSRIPFAALGTSLIFIIFVAALARGRFDAVAAEAADKNHLAMTIILTGLSVGPTFLLEYLFRLWLQVKPLRAKLREVTRGIKGSRRQYERAEQSVVRIDRDGTDWERRAAQLLAVYNTAHQLATAELGRSTTTTTASTALARRESP
jgi:hypothetical protein